MFRGPDHFHDNQPGGQRMRGRYLPPIRHADDVEAMTTRQSIMTLRGLPDGAVLKGCDVLRVVSEVSGVSIIDLKSPRRASPIAKARQVAAWAMRRVTLLSSTQIGNVIGGRDHSTVLYAIRQVDRDPARYAAISGPVMARLADMMDERAAS